MRWFACALALAALVVLGVTAAAEFGGSARADSNSMAAMSLDMDPDNAPANTATSLGSLEPCARIDANGVLDADEDTTADTVTVDVTATGIPVSAPMQSFQYIINYDEGKLTVQTADPSPWLISAVVGSNIFAPGDTVPDIDGSGSFMNSAVDLAHSTHESGSGVLDRLTVSSDAGVAAGQYPLAFNTAESVHGTVDQQFYIPNAFHNGWIAIGQECIVPTDTPVPLFKKGDVDCNDTVDAVDALKVLRKVAGLSVTQNQGCTPLGEGDPAMGDMDCNGSVDAVDALRILRHVAGLNNTLPDGCAPIG